MKVHYSDLSNWQKRLIGNGCGLTGLAWVVPDFIFTDTCNQHDFYYKRGGGLLDKLEADVMLYAHMLQAINSERRSWYKKLGYFLVSTLYFVGVLILGLPLFKYGRYRTLKEIIRKHSHVAN